MARTWTCCIHEEPSPSSPERGNHFPVASETFVSRLGRRSAEDGKTDPLEFDPFDDMFVACSSPRHMTPKIPPSVTHHHTPPHPMTVTTVDANHVRVNQCHLAAFIVLTIMSPRPPWLCILLWFLQYLHLVQGLQHVKVCRNKTCCKRSPHLLESIADLLGTNRVDDSGCLAQCEKGPNVQLQIRDQPPVILHELDDVTTAAIQLEVAAGVEIPKLLKAAAKVLEKVSRTEGMTNTCWYFSSIRSL